MLCMLISHRGLAEGVLVSLTAHHSNVAGLGQLLPFELASSCAHTLGLFSQALRRLSIMFHFQAKFQNVLNSRKLGALSGCRFRHQY